MKGYQILINNSQRLTGGISAGSTMVLITFKDEQFRILFNSMDDTGKISYTWYTGNLTVGDEIKLKHQEISEAINPVQVVDYNNEDEINNMALDNYYSMREELINEGVLPKTDNEKGD